jgi:hypothetical protein
MTSSAQVVNREGYFIPSAKVRDGGKEAKIANGTSKNKLDEMMAEFMTEARVCASKFVESKMCPRKNDTKDHVFSSSSSS